jgi:ABC-type spermidine/putrescine transport system permease subunit II
MQVLLVLLSALGFLLAGLVVAVAVYSRRPNGKNATSYKWLRALLLAVIVLAVGAGIALLVVSTTA